jgi:cytochrome b561
MRKSSPDRYGTVVVSIHWISVMLVLALLGSGFLAANAGSAAAQAGLLRFHVPAGIALLALTIARALWRADRRPGVPDTPPRPTGSNASCVRSTASS